MQRHRHQESIRFLNAIEAQVPAKKIVHVILDNYAAHKHPNETWAMEFVHDQLATGRKLRVLTVVDTFSRFSPVLEPRFTFRGVDVVEVLEEVGRQGGSRRRSGSIKAPSSSRVIWTCGLISAASYSTSRDQASRPTTHSLKRSTDASERNV